MLKKAGQKRIYLGQGEQYLFQGVPFCAEEDPRPFFENRGYKAEWASADLTMPTAFLHTPGFQALEQSLPPCPKEVYFRLARPEDENALLAAVEQVDSPWVPFYRETSTPVMLACREEDILGFALADPKANALFARSGEQMGAIGCVGVVPAARENGVGLQMVREATFFLAGKGCEEIHIGYTHLAYWYARLGYRVRMEFWMGEKEL